MRVLNWAALLFILAAPQSHAFVEFYAAKTEANLSTRSSRIVIARDGKKSTVTLMSGYRGDLKEFAIIVPVPGTVKNGQVRVIDPPALDHLDAYTSPRLVEYTEGDPCRVYFGGDASDEGGSAHAKALGISIESRFSADEYEIVVLSAKDSGQLETWLKENGYKIPEGAGPILHSYVQQKMKFFVAKVNLKELAKAGATPLRPLQITYESAKFTLPIQLARLGAESKIQDIRIFTLTRKGRVEASNYPTVQIPSGAHLPESVSEESGKFYEALLTRSIGKEKSGTVFTEFSGNVNGCDPCLADPMTVEELRLLGASWVPDESTPPAGASIPITVPGKFQPRSRMRQVPPPGQTHKPVAVFATRLHIRYEAGAFTKDLILRETGDSSSFQTRFTIQHPWKGDPKACKAAQTYVSGLSQRHENEAENLARLTGWDIQEIRNKALPPK